jgi:hypothetical protein
VSEVGALASGGGGGADVRARNRCSRLLRAAGSGIYGEAAATRVHERPVEPDLGRGWQVRREPFRAPASLVAHERVHRTTPSEVSQFRRDQSKCPDERHATYEVPRSFGTSERVRGNEARGPPACWA